MWARHLGDDILASAGTSVVAIGDGCVVWSEVRAGKEGAPNWGGLVIVGHQHQSSGEKFYSLYGHMRDITVSVGDVVSLGQSLGVIAEGKTAENGWWKKEHLHFGLYVGPWTVHVLPGYKRPFEGRTKFHWWRDPQEYIKAYNLETSTNS